MKFPFQRQKNSRFTWSIGGNNGKFKIKLYILGGLMMNSRHLKRIDTLSIFEILSLLFLIFCVSNFAMAGELRILKPDNRGSAYDLAASEFQKYYELVCGQKLKITSQFNDEDEYIVLGSDMVNRFVRQLIEEKILDDFPIGIDSDQYRLLSVVRRGKNHLILAGGRGRSTLYAVYDFFERRAGCRWFWDGDVVPKMKTIDRSGLDILEKPRFQYRGIRYFAHRGLYRFQAEHWGFDDWKKEIDWLVKKRLNLFMLRIGQDDLFQKAFPETVSYPDPAKPIPGAGKGYDNRNLFWSLQYRGQLRKKIMNYAFDRDLMHPEDFGTMTHWYSPTPVEFLDKVKPTLAPQVSGYSLKTQLVWDIRDNNNLDNYWKLTQASIDHYGRPEIFHTIGFAERMCYKDREDNLKLKIYFYRRALEKVRAHYPNAPIMLAGWDFYGWWKKNEIKQLLDILDPEKTLILDYSLDLADDGMTGGLSGGKTFVDWDIVGKFPYIVGLFLAYESALDIRGRYDHFQKNQSIAVNDPKCKGFILWPESSHTDIFMLDYFTRSSWKPGEKPEEILARFCRDRYGKQFAEFNAIWKEVIPVSQTLTAAWNYWAEFSRMKTSWMDLTALSENYRNKAEILKNSPKIFHQLGETVRWTDEFTRRDSIDLARTTADRLLILAKTGLLRDLNLYQEGRISADQIRMTADAYEKLASGMADLLALHDDYSIYKTFVKINKIEPVRNPNFPKVLLDNASNGYCMSHQYELAANWYLPTIRELTNWAKSSVLNNGKIDFKKGRATVLAKRNEYYERTNSTPLTEMAPQSPQTFEQFAKIMKVMKENAEIILRDKR